MPIILKDKSCVKCGVSMPQVHPAMKYCPACKEVLKKEKLKVLAETYPAKPKRKEVEVPVGALSQADGEHLVQIYAMPMNPWLRLIEFKDGTHGSVAVRRDTTLRTGMYVTVRKGERGSAHQLVGRYNRWGVRVK